MTEGEERLLAERKRKIFDFLLKKKLILVVIGILVLLFIAWQIRTINVSQLKDVTTGDYTLGPDLDPFLFLRYSEQIIETGSIAEYDSMRYMPLGYDTSTETRLLPYMISYFHKFLSIFSSVSLNYSAVMFPAVMFLLTVIAFFLLIRKIFDRHRYKNIIAFISSLFLIVSPSLISRTVAGIPEKESAGFLFMFLAFYFFLCSWKSEKLKGSLIFAVLAGLSTAAMGLIWGGWIYVFVIIAPFVFIMFISGRVSKNRFFAYTLWMVISFILANLFWARYTIKNLIVSTTTGLSFIVFGILLVDFLIFNTKLKELGLIERLRKKLPDRVVSIVLTAIAGIVVLTLLFGFSFIPDFVKEIFTKLSVPYTDRLSYTVAENRQPYFSEWKNNFGPMLSGVPLFFWLFFVGSIFLFYESIKKMEKKGRYLLISSYIIFLFALIFSRYSSASLMNGDNFISRFVYFGGYALIALAAVYLFYRYYKEGSLHELKKINFSYLFLLGFFFISLVGARSAIRLIMVLSIPAAGIVGWFSVFAVNKAMRYKEGTLKIFAIIIAGIIVISSAYSIYFNYQVTISGARGMIPNMYTQQWQKAMAWVRDNTPENAVFSHWWDYGYWVQTIGNRPTVLDGGNAIAAWNHLFGRHVLTGQSEIEALEFLYAHNVSYLLIDPTEIGKYPAYSSIGSDENYDRYSFMPTFIEDEKEMQETKNEIVHIYKGSAILDEDYSWIDKDGRQIFFPAFRAGIGAVILKTNKEGSELKQPNAIFIYQNRQVEIPLSCVFYNGVKYEFNDGYRGCLYVIPRLSGNEMQNIGSAVFITEKSMKALWVKLYFFNEGNYFKFAHKEKSFIVESLENQGLYVGDFIYYGGVQGPIKIWRVTYPDDIEFKEEYLSKEWPEEVKIAKDIF